MPQPHQDYFPRCQVRLILRFDEFGDEGSIGTPPAQTTKNIVNTGQPRSPYTAQLDPMAQPGVVRYVIALPGQAATVGGPQDQTQSSDGYTFDVTLIPRSIKWKQGGIKTANTCTITGRYVDCPIDPRVCRSVGVEVLLGCVAEDDMVAAIEHTAPPGAPVLPVNYVGPYGETRTNLRFQGFAKTWESELGESEPTFTIEAQDNSMLLHNQQVPPRAGIPVNMPFDQAVAQYLAQNFVQFVGLTVQYLPSTDKAPALQDVLAEHVYVPGNGLCPAGCAAGAEKASVWDFLTDACGMIGHTVRMDGTTLIIQRPRALLANSIAQRTDDPFRSRTVDGVTFGYRRMLYGRNIKSMRPKRNFGSKQAANIEVRSQGGNGNKTTLIGRFPTSDPNGTANAKQNRLRYAQPGNTQPDEKWEVHTFPGIKDQATLMKIAQSIYESKGRQELEFDIKTKNLGSFGGFNTDPDILDCKTGDTIEVLVNRDQDERNTLTNMETQLTALQANAALMVQLGFSQGFADAYAKAYTNANFTTTYRLHTMDVSWAAKDGVQIDMMVF